MSELIVLAVIAGLAAYVVFMYNNLVRLRNMVMNAWSDIDVQLKRRYTLVPQLVDTVKGYAKHEKQLLEDLTEARTKAKANEGTPAEQGETEKALSGALMNVLAVAENYPDLKANENFAKLQAELSETEDKIALSRRFYNGSVRALNNSCDMFPSNLIAKAFSFRHAEFFEVEDDARAPAAVNFD